MKNIRTFIVIAHTDQGVDGPRGEGVEFRDGEIYYQASNWFHPVKFKDRQHLELALDHNEQVLILDDFDDEPEDTPEEAVAIDGQLTLEPGAYIYNDPVTPPVQYLELGDVDSYDKTAAEFSRLFDSETAWCRAAVNHVKVPRPSDQAVHQFFQRLEDEARLSNLDRLRLRQTALKEAIEIEGRTLRASQRLGNVRCALEAAVRLEEKRQAYDELIREINVAERQVAA